METETTLEGVLKGGQASGETEEVLEEKEEPKEELEEKKEEEVDPFTAENFESRVQASVDKGLNTYREKRESDTAIIRSLQTQVREAKVTKGGTHLNQLMKAITDSDEAVSVGADKLVERKEAFDEIVKIAKSNDEKSAEIEETAEFIKGITENLSQHVVKEFGLDDANPNIRASNGVKLLDEAIAAINHNQDFLMTVESFLPKGDELRTQIEEIVEGLAEFDTEKSKKLYLKDKVQGVKVVRKKLPTPSDGSGGVDLFKMGSTDLIMRGLQKMNTEK